MCIRWLACLLLCVLLAVAALGKEKLTPQALMAKSDALYYFPTAHGIKDLAVDLVIDQIQDDPVGQKATVSFCYAGMERQLITVSNVPKEHAKFQEALLGLMTPLGQYIIPRTATVSFAGLPVKMKKITALIAGAKETSFFQISGEMPADQASDIKELRVLLDKNGLLYRIENVMKNGASVVGSVENTHTPAGWHVVGISTRLMTAKGTVWKIERIEYAVLEGYTLPVRYTAQYRDQFNRAVKGMDDLSVTMTNYRINAGVADDIITRAQAAATPPPAP